jgi:septation ring formation regulator EzrA
MKNIKGYQDFNENLDESSNKELKSFQKELKSLERKKSGLTDLQKKQIKPSAYYSKTKVDLAKVEKEIKDINAKIAALKK